MSGRGSKILLDYLNCPFSRGKDKYWFLESQQIDLIVNLLKETNMTKRTPKEIIGEDLHTQLLFEGYEIVPASVIEYVRGRLKHIIILANIEPAMRVFSDNALLAEKELQSATRHSKEKQEKFDTNALKRNAVEWYKSRFDRSDIIGMPSDREVLFDFIDYLSSMNILQKN